eukprot:2470351-Rhodomonas_salina.1
MLCRCAECCVQERADALSSTMRGTALGLLLRCGSAMRGTAAAFAATVSCYGRGTEQGYWALPAQGSSAASVSYTHLTLPTICSV